MAALVVFGISVDRRAGPVGLFYGAVATVFLPYFLIGSASFIVSVLKGDTLIIKGENLVFINRYFWSCKVSEISGVFVVAGPEKALNFHLVGGKSKKLSLVMMSNSAEEAASWLRRELSIK
jgi:hypothetical protein